MTFGWARTEIIGGLVNGCFLLSLSLYIVLEAIPRLIPYVVNSKNDGDAKSFHPFYVLV